MTQKMLKIETVVGPTRINQLIEPPGPIMVGRRPSHPIHLSGSDQVSRDHAMLSHETHNGSPQWLLTDTGSRHGTRLNGIAIEPHQGYPIRHGDLIDMAPWVFQVIDQGDSATRVQTISENEDSSSVVHTLKPTATPSVISQRLQLLLDLAHRMQEAPDEPALAEAVVDAAVEGSGFANIALLGPPGSDGTVSVLAHRGDILSNQDKPRLSQSLIRQAAQGSVASMVRPANRVRGKTPVDFAKSIADLAIDEALCAPIMLGGAPAGYLYLDNRQDQRGQTLQGAGDFVVGLTQLAAMSWANLRRLDLERRFGLVQADLAAAAEARNWVLPGRREQFGPLTILSESRAGRTLGGDFVDMIRLSPNRFAITVGDVSGKGVAASVLTTTAQGFLYASLAAHHDLARAVRELNAYVHPRRNDYTFLTLWAGVIDLETKTLTYVDAGHGYAWRSRPGQDVTRLCESGDIPIGLENETAYAAAVIDFLPGDQIFVVTDGLVEQPGCEKEGEPQREFSAARVIQVLQSSRIAVKDPVFDLFQRVVQFAGQSGLADDASAVWVSWT